MENLKILTDNLSLNPYTRRSNSMKENNELYTANKSIIRAINEIYLNQKSIYNSIMYIYRNLHVTIGDIIEDKDLKEAYSALQFANIMDGLVKLNNKIDNTSDAAMQRDVDDIKNIIANQDTNITNIFQTMNWDNIIDALIKINQKIADYITQDTTSEAEQYIEIRDDISELISVIGSSDETDKNKIMLKFGSILKAVIALDNFVDASEENLQLLNDNGFVSVAHAIAEFNSRLNEALNDITNLNEAQASDNNKFTSINNTIEELTNDLRALANSMGQATGSDLSDLGYSSIADGLRKLTEANTKIIQIIGDMDDDESEIIRAYKEIGYENYADALVKITNTLNFLASTDPAAIEELTAAGFDSMLIAINTILKTIGIPEVGLETLQEKNYNSIIDAIIKLTDNLESGINSIQEQMDTNNTEMNSRLDEHIEDLEAHPDCVSGYFRHKTNHFYHQGEIVFVSALPNNLCLVCVNEGTTAEESPNFEAL